LSARASVVETAETLNRFNSAKVRNRERRSDRSDNAKKRKTCEIQTL